MTARNDFLRSDGTAGSYARTATAAPALDLCGQFTFGFWYRAETPPAAGAVVWTIDDTGSTARLWSYVDGSVDTAFMAFVSEPDPVVPFGYPMIFDGQWHWQVFRSSNGVNVFPFIDGDIDSPNYNIDDATTGAYDWLQFFADRAGANGAALAIRSPFVFARPISDAEIAGIYAAGPTADLALSHGAYAAGAGMPSHWWPGPVVGGAVVDEGSAGASPLLVFGGVMSFPLPASNDADQLVVRMDATGRISGRETVRIVGADIARDPLREAVYLSLFTWRRAGADDVVPETLDGRQGWWADPDMGSRLYLLARAKASAALLADARHYVEEALAWLVEDKIAESVAVAVERGALGPGVSCSLEIARPREPVFRARYDLLWSTI